MEYHAQYTFADGDIVLQSSDNVKFRVHGVVLKTASSVFAGMIDMPRPAKEASCPDEDEPIVLAESSHVLSFLLATIYPHVDLPSLTSFSDASAFALAADKYEISRAHAILRKVVFASDEFRGQTLRLYALATRFEWKDIIASTSEKTLEWNLCVGASPSDAESLKDHTEQLSELSATEFRDLLQLHLTRKKQIWDQISLSNLTGFYSQLVHGVDGVMWFCPCPGGAHAGMTSAQSANLVPALRAFKDAIAVYLEGEPRGSALFQPVKNRWRFDVEEAAHALRCIHCHNCGKDFFDLEKTLSHFSLIAEDLPNNVYDVSDN